MNSFGILKSAKGGFDAYCGKVPLGNFSSHAQALAGCRAVESFLLAKGLPLDHGRPPRAAAAPILSSGEVKVDQATRRGLRRIGERWYISHPKGANAGGFDSAFEAQRVRAELLKLSNI